MYYINFGNILVLLVEIFDMCCVQKFYFEFDFVEIFIVFDFVNYVLFVIVRVFQFGFILIVVEFDCFVVCYDKFEFFIGIIVGIVRIFVEVVVSDLKIYIWN